MNKKLLISLSIIGAVAMVGIGATTAYFSNTETSSGNTFIAGAIDLKVDSECTYNGQPVDGCTWLPTDLDDELFFNFTDIKPGDNGEDTISLHVDTNPAWICAEISNVEQKDNGCNPPELKAEETAYGVGLGTCGIPGVDEGELQDVLLFSVWMDNGAGEHSCNNIKDEDETYIKEDAKVTDVEWPIADSQHGGVPITDTCIGVAWNVPSSVNNIIQSDSITGDITFKAYQARNNTAFTCHEEDGCFDQADVMLVLDRSGSIDATERAQLKAAAHAFVTALAPDGGVHMGQSSFSDTGSLDLHLTGNQAAINAAIDALAGGTYTNLYEGLDYANTELDDSNTTYERPSVQDYMVVITDGNPNRPSPDANARTLAANEADAARLAGVEIYVVGVGSDVDATYLINNIADDSAHYFGISEYSELEDLLESIATCQTIELPPAPETVSLNPTSGNDTSYYPVGGAHALSGTELGYLVSSDNSRYQSAGFWTNESYNDNEVIDFNFNDIPGGATNISATLNFEWQRDSSDIDGARVRVWDGTTWTNHEFPAPYPSADTDRTESVPLPEIDSAAKLNTMIIRFQAHDGGTNLYTRHDWVQVDVTYTP